MIFNTHQSPSLYFPVDEMKADGVYDSTIELCKQHGRKKGSDEAGAMRKRKKALCVKMRESNYPKRKSSD